MLHVVILASLILPDVDKDIQIEVALSRHNQYEEAVKYLNMDIEKRPLLWARNVPFYLEETSRFSMV